MNIETTELENGPPENGSAEESSLKSRSGPGKPSGPPPAAAQEKPPKRGGSFLAFLAFVLSVLAAGVAGWTWWQAQQAGSAAESRAIAEVARLDAENQELSLKINQLRDALEQVGGDDSSAELASMQRRLEGDRRQVAELEQAVQEQFALSRSLQAATETMQGRLRAAESAVTGLSTRELDAGGELDLAEVDYLLRLANERLKLFHDPRAADDALEVADLHLAALDNPMYFSVRQEIAAARQALAAVEVPEYLDIAGRLDAIQSAVPSLEFIDGDAPAEVSEPTEDDGWWASLKAAFSGLVTVRRSAGDSNGRISLEDKDYIRQRVWLQLEIAHLALMRQDQDAFREALSRADESISAWFDPAAGPFGEVSDGIDELMAVRIEVEVPDITAPWTTLRLLRHSAPSSPAVEDAGDAPDEAVEPADETG